MTTDRANMRGTGRRFIGFALLAVLISFSAVVMDSRTTKAESLLDRLSRCGLFGWSCPDVQSPQQKQTTTPTPAPQNSPSQTEPTTPAPSTDNGSATRSGPVTPQLLEPITFNEELRKPLPERIDWTPQPQSKGGVSGIQANVFSIAGGEEGVLGASVAAAPLERSDQGWVIMGLAWYWWAIIGGGLAIIGLWIRHRVLKRNLNLIAEPKQ